ncbi:MAG: hypothetical protein LBS84_09130 [Clostridiales bacterium]|jgi:hypothetical protein|nr:hypothetical protein [Clostridiales bacterium]
MAYTIEKKIFCDALSNTYDIVDEYNVHYSMTEYYSASITNQTHTILSEQKYLNLYRGLWTLKNMLLPRIPRIIHVEDANGIFVVWESFYGISLKDYMELYNKRVSCKAALSVMSALLDDCESAHQNGVYFTVSPETIYLTDGGELCLNTMANPSASVNSVNRGIAQCFFCMLTGLPYGNLQIPVDEFIPAQPRSLLDGVLSGRLEFGGVGEFHSALRAALRVTESGAPIAEDYNAIREKRKLSPVSKAAIGIGVFSVLMLSLIVFSIAAISDILGESSQPANSAAETDSYGTSEIVDFIAP